MIHLFLNKKKTMMEKFIVEFTKYTKPIYREPVMWNRIIKLKFRVCLPE